MFSFSQARSKTITTYVLFGSIILVFVFFKYYPDQTGMAGYAASINHETISIAEFKQANERMAQYYNSLFGGRFGNDAQQQAQIQRATLEQLISREVVAQGAEANGLVVSDVEVRDVIVGIPAFQKDGRFSRDSYNAYLNYQGLTAGKFEHQLRREVLSRKAQEFLDSSLSPSEAEVRKSYDARETKLNLMVASLDDTSGAKIDDASVQKYLADAATKKKAEDYFNSHKKEFSQDEQVRAAHILISIDPKDPKGAELAKQKIDEIAARATKEDFGKLATEFSQDPGSKANNGDLGFFGRGRMVGAFEKVAFSAEVGKISEPVKTDFGYHLIKVLEKKGAKEATFDDAKNQIARRMIGEDREKARLEELRTALQAGDNAKIESILKDSGAKWEETGFFAQNSDQIPKVPGGENSLKEIFSLSEKTPWLKSVVSSGNKHMIVKFKEVKAAPEPKPSDLKTVQDDLARLQSMDVLSRWTEDLKKKSQIIRNNSLMTAN